MKVTLWDFTEERKKKPLSDISQTDSNKPDPEGNQIAAGLECGKVCRNREYKLNEEIYYDPAQLMQGCSLGDVFSTQ